MTHRGIRIECIIAKPFKKKNGTRKIWTIQQMTENRKTEKSGKNTVNREPKIKMSRLNPITSVKTVAINGLHSPIIKQILRWLLKNKNKKQAQFLYVLNKHSPKTKW